jgi:hypothetical protein
LKISLPTEEREGSEIVHPSTLTGRKVCIGGPVSGATKTNVKSGEKSAMVMCEWRSEKIPEIPKRRRQEGAR